jgi:hypothetical protein
VLNHLKNHSTKPLEPNLEKNGTWTLTDVDQFKFADPTLERKNCKPLMGMKGYFNAVGQRWQETDVSGTCDWNIGLLGLSEIARANLSIKFRLFELVLAQTSSMIAEMDMSEELAAE